jgi:hypothetical protein
MKAANVFNDLDTDVPLLGRSYPLNPLQGAG